MNLTRVILLVAGIVVMVILMAYSIKRSLRRPYVTPNQQVQLDQAETKVLLPKLPPGSLHELDLPYVAGTHSGVTLDSIQTLDLFVPPGRGPFPLVIWIHGGGWHAGGKGTSGVHFALDYLPKGFAFAALNYRLVGDAPFPAQIEDCNAALAWLRQHAAEYRLDPNRVGVIGHSAGAHLAALMAVTGDSPRFSPNIPGGSRIQAAVCWATPADLDVDRGQWPKPSIIDNPKSEVRSFFPHATYDAAFAREASPASYVHAGIPPILIVHGAKDGLVPLGQARAFAEALKNAGVDVTFRVDPTHDHNILTALSFREALAFFEETLMPPPVDSEPPK